MESDLETEAKNLATNGSGSGIEAENVRFHFHFQISGPYFVHILITISINFIFFAHNITEDCDVYYTDPKELIEALISISVIREQSGALPRPWSVVVVANFYY